MDGRKIETVLRIVFSILLHGLAFLQFRQQWASYDLPDDWFLDFVLLLGLSLTLMVILHAFRSFRLQVVVITARIIVFLIIGLPFGGFMDIRYMLLFSLFLDIHARFRYPRNILLFVIVLASSSVFLVPHKVFSFPRPAPGLSAALSFFLIGTGFAAFLVILQNTIARNHEAMQRVAALNAVVSRLVGVSRDYLEYADRVERQSIMQERNRIIRDLHDVVGQAFTNIFAVMDASIKHPPDAREEERELHTWIKEQAQKGLNETRAALYELRSITDRELTGIQAIWHLVKTFSRSTRVQVHVEWGNLPWKVDPALDDVIYRVIQESLINAYRHGNASAIQIHFWLGDRELELNIQDNGAAPASANKGIGQESMERRVTGIGGTISFVGMSHGYKVHARFPKHLVETNEANASAHL